MTCVVHADLASSGFRRELEGSAGILTFVDRSHAASPSFDGASRRTCRRCFRFFCFNLIFRPFSSLSFRWLFPLVHESHFSVDRFLVPDAHIVLSLLVFCPLVTANVFLVSGAFSLSVGLT